MKLRTLFIGGAAAAAARYLFDPEQGAARRTQLKDRAMSRVGDLGGRAKGSASGVAQGAVQQMKERAAELKSGATSATSTIVVEDIEIDDQQLHDRVQTEVLGRVDVPKDRIVVNVEDGIVVLRGELDAQGQIDDVLQKVGAVSGVRAIDSLLHVHGTPAPNKREALEASDRAAGDAPSTGTAIE
jgi:osmotically-inducible protein OsmY